MTTLRLLAAALVLGSIPGVARAQVAPDRAARAIEELTGLDLSIRRPPTPDDYQLAADLLSFAVEFDPDATEIARSMSEAAWSAGDNQSLIEATRAIVRADPRDTVAQLRLISAIINRTQTVDERIKAYERFTGDRAAQAIPASVRSRLLLDAALMRRESGDDAGFERMLRRAARLDPTHKEAQAMLAQSVASGGVSEPTHLRLQIRLLKADPIDPHIHIAIARLCAAEGATDSAWRFLNNAADIYARDRGQPPASLQEQLLSLEWQYEGPQSILDKLNPALEDDRATLQARIDARLEMNEPIDDLGDPMDIRFNPGIDRIRLLAAHALDDRESVRSVLDDLRRGVRDVYDNVLERMEKRGANKGYLLGVYLQEVITLQTMRAITGVDPDVINNDIDRIVSQAPSLEPFFRPFEPFTLYVNGEYERARDLAVNKLVESASRDLLIALSSDKLGEMDRAAKEYIALTRDYPLEAHGAFARSRLRQIREGEAFVTEEGHEMARLTGEIPGWMDEMIHRPENTMRLRIAPLDDTFETHEPARVAIELRNLTPRPIAVGTDHPVNSDMLIVPGFRGKTGDLRGDPRPRVADLSRRLRLAPRETLRVELNPDSIQTRWLLRTNCMTNHSQRWRVLQGFQPLAGGGIINSPFGLTTETQLIQRRLIPETKAPLDELIGSLGGTNPATTERVVATSAAILLNPESRPDLSEDDHARLVDALWELFERADAPTRAWMLATLPPAAAAPPMAPFDRRVIELVTGDSLAGDAPDAAVLAVVLMTRVTAMPSPALEIARSHDDRRVRGVAAMIEHRLDALETLFSSVTDPYKTLTPASDRDIGDL